MPKRPRFRVEVWRVRTAAQCGCFYQTFSWHVQDAAGCCRVVCTHLSSALKHAGPRYVRDAETLV